MLQVISNVYDNMSFGNYLGQNYSGNLKILLELKMEGFIRYVQVTAGCSSSSGPFSTFH